MMKINKSVACSRLSEEMSTAPSLLPAYNDLIAFTTLIDTQYDHKMIHMNDYKTNIHYLYQLLYCHTYDLTLGQITRHTRA